MIHNKTKQKVDRLLAFQNRHWHCLSDCSEFVKMKCVRENQKKWNIFYILNIPLHTASSPFSFWLMRWRNTHATGTLEEGDTENLLELCLARYLSLYFFFFPKGLQLGASFGADWATLATLLWETDDQSSVGPQYKSMWQIRIPTFFSVVKFWDWPTSLTL